jgi:UDP-glucose 4-epimerase
LVVYGDGSQAYDFVYVTDCADANVCAMRSDSVDAFYNVGTGTRTTIRQVAEALLDITGSDVGIRYEPGGLTFVKNRIGDPSAAARDLGFTAGVPLEQGLRALIEWRVAHAAKVDELRREALVD